MRQKAAQCKYTGGPLSFGYVIDDEGYYALDPVTSPVVKEIFERYKGIYVYADIKIPDNENYRKMLVRSFVDRIYLYDDHFRILLNNGGKRGKSSKREAAEVERYFDSMSSETTLYAPPKSQGGAHLCEVMMGRT